VSGWQELLATVTEDGDVVGQVLEPDASAQQRAFEALRDGGWITSGSAITDELVATVGRDVRMDLSFWSEPELGTGVDFVFDPGLLRDADDWTALTELAIALADAAGRPVVLGDPDADALVLEPGTRDFRPTVGDEFG
jgi:hypothetical protein